jgi:hypothetical protein
MRTAESVVDVLPPAASGDAQVLVFDLMSTSSGSSGHIQGRERRVPARRLIEGEMRTSRWTPASAASSPWRIAGDGQSCAFQTRFFTRLIVDHLAFSRAAPSTV